MNRKNPLEKLLAFLMQLEKRKIHYALEHNRDESIMVLIAVPGQRWEAEFFKDGHVEIEVFGRSKGVESGREAQRKLKRMLAENTD